MTNLAEIGLLVLCHDILILKVLGGNVLTWQGSRMCRWKDWQDSLRICSISLKQRILSRKTYTIHMDKSGFAIGDIEASQRIINATIRQKFQAKPGSQEWVTAVEWICTDGSFLPPLIIFKGENLSHQWIPASIHNNWRFGCNMKEWTSNHVLSHLLGASPLFRVKKKNGDFLFEKVKWQICILNLWKTRVSLAT